MRSLIRQLEPDRFEDLMALNALYRPGPLSAGMHIEYAERKHGRRPVSYPHPDLEGILGATYGIMVYQEQIMQIAVQMAGYSMGQADELRRVMGKKKRELVGAERESSCPGAVAQGHPEKLAEELFDLIVPFADYGFNAAARLRVRAHRVPDRVPEAHHSRRIHVGPPHERAGRQGQQALLPERGAADGHRGPAAGRQRVGEYFAPPDEGVRYGLAAVRNVGEGAVQQIITARPRRGRSSRSRTSAGRSSPAC